MARHRKQGLDYFPKWNPFDSTIKRFNHKEFDVRYKALRNSSSSFVRRKDVREYIFLRDGKICAECGSKENPTIDHIKSVHACARQEFHYSELNTKENLRVLCNRCNSKITP